MPPSPGHGESYESVFAYDSSVHQKCFDYALTNLLFGLCRFVRVIELLVIHSNPILELQHAPLPPKCCEPVSAPQLLLLPLSSHLDLQLSPSRSLGVRHHPFASTKSSIYIGKFGYILELCISTINTNNCH
jgi:hypothetical protein